MDGCLGLGVCACMQVRMWVRVRVCVMCVYMCIETTNRCITRYFYTIFSASLAVGSDSCLDNLFIAFSFIQSIMCVPIHLHCIHLYFIYISFNLTHCRGMLVLSISRSFSFGFFFDFILFICYSHYSSCWCYVFFSFVFVIFLFFRFLFKSFNLNLNVWKRGKTIILRPLLYSMWKSFNSFDIQSSD